MYKRQAVDKETGQAFHVIGKTKGWWTVQAPGASEPLSRRASSLTPCAPPPPDANTETQLGGDAPADDAEPPKKPAAQPKKRGRPPKVVEDEPAAELGASEAASSLEAKIKAAIAKKPDVAAESAAMVLYTPKQVDGLRAAGITCLLYTSPSPRD